MIYYFIICRSLTYAQRAASVLEKAGITAYIRRTPTGLAKTGCSHSVVIRERQIKQALDILLRLGLKKPIIYKKEQDGTYQEAVL